LFTKELSGFDNFPAIGFVSPVAMAFAITKREEVSPMVAGILVALMLITCIGFELCMVPRGRDEQDVTEGE
jgi:hypothetical protein